MNRSILVLKSRRNLLIPICRLPAEVLANVFMHCTSNIPAFVDGNLAKGRETLFRIARVCHHWRTIALNTPELWSRPDFSLGPPLALEMLDRSRDAPLVIEAEVGDETVDMLSEALVRHISRITALHLTVTGFPASMEQLLFPLIQPAPFLRVLSLAFAPLAHVWGQTTRKLHLPDTFLANYAPRLTSLALRSFQVPLDSPLLKNITTLSLDMSRWPSTSALELVESLRDMTHLEVLEVRDPFQHFDPGTMGVSTSSTDVLVKFSCLRYLRMDGAPISQVVRFLEHTTFPESVVVMITTFEDSFSEFDALVSSLSRIFSCSSHDAALVDPVKSIHIGHPHSLSAWSLNTLPPVYPFFHPEHTGSSPPHLRTQIGLGVRNDSRIGFESFISRMVSTLGTLTHLRALHLKVAEGASNELSSGSQTCPAKIEPSVKDFTTSFGSLPNLDTIRLMGELASVLMAAFGHNENGVIKPFPAIHTLELRGARQSASNEKLLLPSIADILSDVTNIRRKHGLQFIKKLMLRRCGGLQADDVKRISELLIGDVEWDEWREDEHEFEFQVNDGDEDPPSPSYRPSITVM
ncbi:hypothetical protein L218DRAFT_7706 [Marasmius fiardii PR-910]|nr:hypothetical protein L218DRAFT_7706 [Marasmius fiardii PR-910]